MQLTKIDTLCLEMANRKIREFQRLLARSDEIVDVKFLKANSRLLESKFNDLRADGVLSGGQIAEFTTHMKAIQQRLAPQIALPKPKPVPARCDTDDDTADISKERIKQDAITSDLLNLTYQLKDNVGKVALVSASDAEVLTEVVQNVEGIATGAEKTQNQFTEVTGERLGWKVYYWLVLVILTYVLVTFLFL
jgi:hypothetical protein